MLVGTNISNVFCGAIFELIVCSTIKLDLLLVRAQVVELGLAGFVLWTGCVVVTAEGCAALLLLWIVFIAAIGSCVRPVI